MPEKVANIAKNTSYFTFALILQKIISFSWFIIIARALGPEDLGKYYFAISFTSIFAILIDLGFANVLTREIAKDSGKTEKLVGTVLGLKVPLAFITMLAVSLAINLMGYPALTRQLVYLSIICMILDSFSLTFFSTIRGFHNLFYESIASVIFQAIIIASGSLILYYRGDLRVLMGSLILASIFFFLYSMYLVVKKWKIRLRLIYDQALIKAIFSITIAFTLYAVFQRVYTYLDSVLLSAIAGDRQVGLYQIAFKIIYALQFLPLAFIASLYPALSLYWARNKLQLVVTFERAINYLVIISLPVSIGIIMLADKIIFLFNEGYGDAVLPLQISMASLFFLFINFPIGAMLNACDRQNQNTANMGVTMLAAVALNLVLIPKYQAVGASITVLATQMLMLALGIYQIPKIIRFNPKNIFKTLGKSLLAVFLMGATVLLMKPHLNFFAIIILAGMAYFALLFILKAFRKEDLASIYKSFASKKARL